METTTPPSFADVHARHVAALAHYNALPDTLEETDPAAFKHEEEAYGAASCALDEATPGNWREFAIALQHAIGGGGHPGRETADRLVARAEELADKSCIGALDLYTLDRAMQRVDYVAATADLLSDIDHDNPRMSETMRGLYLTLNEQAEVIDGILEPHRRALLVGREG